MSYIPLTSAEQKKMLDVVGVASVEDLFADVPKDLRLGTGGADLGGADAFATVDGGGSEIELVARVAAVAARNVDATSYVCFAGGGCYDHYQPAFIDHLLRRPEFFTAYTPYQPEVSQGTLQAIYEYQTGICELTGLDAANASMYDGATALAEAAFMAVRLARKRSRVLVAETLHPEKIETLKTYAASGLIELEILPASGADGVVLDYDTAKAALTASAGEVAAILLPYPNYYGLVEDIASLIDAAHEVGALAVLDTNPLMLGVLTSPGVLGADIAVGEGQPLGNAMNFGGPGLGYFACTTACLRQMPGRLVGRTTDVDGKTGYVLTLATREQHIRREKATSNICSNHALNALAAGMYLAAAGPCGLRDIATDCIAKAHYLRGELLGTGLFTAVDSAATSEGYEFCLRYVGGGAGARGAGVLSREAWHEELFKRGYLAGILTDTPGDGVLFAVTEKRTKHEIDAFVEEVRNCG